MRQVLTAASIATTLAVLAGAGTAAAQPGMTPAGSPPPPPAPAPYGTPAPYAPPAPYYGSPYGGPVYAAPAPVVQGERVSEGTALALSLGGTVVSWAMMAGAAGFSDDPDTQSTLSGIGALGTFLAPSFGHWYTGSYLTRGMGLRAVGIGAMFVGIIAAFSSHSHCDIGEGHGGGCSSGDDGNGTAIALLIGGAGLYLGGTVDDILAAPRKARRRNERLAGIGLAPIVTQRTTGLALGGRF